MTETKGGIDLRRDRHGVVPWGESGKSLRPRGRWEKRSGTGIISTTCCGTGATITLTIIMMTMMIIIIINLTVAVIIIKSIIITTTIINY